MSPPLDPVPQPGVEDRRIRQTWRSFAAALAAAGLVVAVRLVSGGAGVLDWVLAGLLLAAGVAALLHRRAVADLEARRRIEAESTTRLLRGLSRSVSADAILAAIAGELASGVEADHVVVVRRRTDPVRLEATLVSTRPGIPSSVTALPLADLTDPVEPPSRAGPASSAPVAVAERIARRASSVYALRNTLAAPLVADSEVVGALVLSRRVAAPWPVSTQRLLEEAATEASVALTRATSHRAAETRASTDALTGLPNRRYFDEFCGLLARRRRAGDAVGVLMVDIDHFKRLNDTHGHAVGDEVLRDVAAAIGAAVREDDVPARYGGEEFAVLLRNPSREVAVGIAERVRVAVGDLDLRRLGVASVSVSVGVAVQDAPDQAITDIVEVADRALYRAKRAGRDRVVAA